MKKKLKKEENVKEEVEILEQKVIPQLGRLTVTFPNEDLNKVVEYINKLAEEIQKCH